MPRVGPCYGESNPRGFKRQHCYVVITGDRELELLGRYEENAYLLRMMKLTGHTKTTLFELQGFDHGGMAEPAFPLLLKEVAAVTKEILEKKQRP